jgi:hypothetical protein
MLTTILKRLARRQLFGPAMLADPARTRPPACAFGERLLGGVFRTNRRVRRIGRAVRWNGEPSLQEVSETFARSGPQQRGR